MLFQCGRWARHCYITSLLTLHWSINNRPIQVANNRPIYVVGCTWSSNTCKVLYFWFGGQNDLLRTMWYFIIQLILHLYNILGLVSGKFEISRLYIYWTIASWSAASLLTQRPLCWRHLPQLEPVWTLKVSLTRKWYAQKEECMPFKWRIGFDGDVPHQCHRNRNPQVRSWDNGPRIWKKNGPKCIFLYIYKNGLRPGTS